MKSFLLAAIFAAPVAANADVGGFVEGGVTKVEGEETASSSKLMLDDGSGFMLSGGVRWSSGFMIKGEYSSSTYDGGEVTRNGRQIATITQDVEISDLRIGFYGAPVPEHIFGYRWGVGFAAIATDATGFNGTDANGVYGEGALLINAGRIVTFDTSLALIALGGMEGAEFRAGATFHVGRVDLGLMYRSQGLSKGLFSGDIFSDTKSDFDEWRLTIGSAWGYGRRR